jgi:hypothetical protein
MGTAAQTVSGEHYARGRPIPVSFDVAFYVGALARVRRSARREFACGVCV